jgi:hypothetical protein
VPLPPPTVEGLKVAVAPVGSPAVAKATVPVNPLKGLTLTASVPLLPAVTVAIPGPDKVKSGVSQLTGKSPVYLAFFTQRSLAS